jgi:hemolysin activation/secretion protein
LRQITLAAAAVALAPAWAQAQALPPDAGLLQLDKGPMKQPTRPQELPRPVDPRLAADASPSARTVAIDRVVVEGSSLVSQEEWDQRFFDVSEQALSLAQMRALAAQVQRVVQQAGRPFAVAYLPPQDLSTRELVIRVVEGRYGQVTGQGALASEGAGWMTPLRPGQPIGPELERQMLLLSELPGVKSVATVSPGAQPGDADVSVEVTPARAWGGEIRVDNHGNRYAGRYRVLGSLHVDRLLLLGDQLSLVAGTGDQGGGQGLIAYAFPLGAQGVRLELSGGFSRYQLGKEFDILDASGNVATVAGTVSVPLQVTQRSRVTWQTGLQGQRISNRQRLFEVEDARTGVAWLNTVQATRWLSGGGAMWGKVSAETGRIRLNDDLSRQTDALTARTAGAYLLVSVDASAVQPLGDWSVYGHVAGQVADRNLDPSKKWVLGGPNGVRAWPASEGSGDDGALAQVELRRQMGGFQPFAFFDAGRVQINHQPWVEGRNSRSMAGAGVGLRMTQGPWQLQSTAGWRIGAGHKAPQSDPGAGAMQFWLSLGYQL